MATTTRLSLVQGPPGTGKTALAVQIVLQWVQVGRLAGANTTKQPKTSQDPGVFWFWFGCWCDTPGKQSRVPFASRSVQRALF